MEFLTKFRKEKSLQIRREETERMRHKHPSRIPVLVDRADRNAPPLVDDKHKFLVPSDFTVSQLQCMIRKRLPELKPTEALFLSCEKDRSMPAGFRILSDLFKDKADDAGFVVILYQGETVFG